MTAVHVAAGLELPVELAGRRSAIFGISGSGKSNTAAVIVEELLRAGEQIVLIDPKGEGWGLLSLPTGKPSNLPIIVFGEPNGHIPAISETHGPRLADFVVETGQSVVLSLLGFESDQSERRFVASFLRQLYRKKSRQAGATRTLVVLEEAHLFVPENVRGDGAELAGAVQRIVRQGRSFGIGTLLVDQRPQDVSKRAITQCDTLICHQLSHKTDRSALSDWVKGYDTDGRGEQFLAGLAALEPGEAWVWSPAWLKIFERHRLRRRRTFDTGAAPDGSHAARTMQRAEVDLDALRDQLAEVLDKAKADDPKELRRQIAELQRKLDNAGDIDAVRNTLTMLEQEMAKGPKIVEVPALKNGQLDRTEKLQAALEAVGQKLLNEAATLGQLIAAANTTRLATVSRHAPAQITAAAPPTRPPLVSVKGVSADFFRPPAQGGLTRPQQAILDVAAMLGRRGIIPDRETIARWLDLHPRGGSYGTNLKTLHDLGLLADCCPTPLGERSAADLQTGIDAAIIAMPRDSVRRVLGAIVDFGRQHGKQISREELAEVLGVHPRGGSFGENLKHLRDMQLIVADKRGIGVTEALFR